MPQKFPLTPSDEQIEAVSGSDGPWEVEIIARLFKYSPYEKTEENPTGGFAVARAGDVVTLLNRDDYVKGLRFGVFVDQERTAEAAAGEGPGDFAARPDLVEFVKEHSTDEVLAYAAGNADVAAMLIDAEQEALPHNGTARKGVISGLQAVIDTYLDETTPVEPGDGDTTIAERAAAAEGPEGGDEDGTTGDDEPEGNVS